MPSFNPFSSVTGRNSYSLFDIRCAPPPPVAWVAADGLRGRPTLRARGLLTPPPARHSLDQDFIVFRGTNDESAGQLLKGVVVLCLSSSLRIEDVHLRLTGTLRFS